MDKQCLRTYFKLYTSFSSFKCKESSHWMSVHPSAAQLAHYQYILMRYYLLLPFITQPSWTQKGEPKNSWPIQQLGRCFAHERLCNSSSVTTPYCKCKISKLFKRIKGNIFLKFAHRSYLIVRMNLMSWIPCKSLKIMVIMSLTQSTMRFLTLS